MVVSMKNTVTIDKLTIYIPMEIFNMIVRRSRS